MTVLYAMQYGKRVTLLRVSFFRGIRATLVRVVYLSRFF